MAFSHFVWDEVREHCQHALQKSGAHLEACGIRARKRRVPGVTKEVSNYREGSHRQSTK